MVPTWTNLHSHQQSVIRGVASLAFFCQFGRNKNKSKNPYLISISIVLTNSEVGQFSYLCLVIGCLFL